MGTHNIYLYGELTKTTIKVSSNICFSFLSVYSRNQILFMPGRVDLM